MPNPFDALISGSESDGEGGAKNKPIATKKPANPAVEVAKARNTSQAPSKPVQTARVAEPQKATAKPTAVRTPKVYANAPPATELAMDEKDLKTRDHITDSKPHQHTRAGERGRGGAGRGVPRGRGAGFAPRGGKREFDRRSGSGHIRNELKREGRGAHNWGGATDNAEVDKVLAEVQKNNNNVSGETLVPTKPDTTTAEEEDHGGVTVETKPKPEGEGGEVETEVKAEPEKPTLSLEEYLAQKNEKRRGAAFKELGEVEVEDVSEGRAYAKKDAVVADTEDAYFSVQTSGGKINKKPTSGAAAAVKENKEEKDKKKAAAVVVETGFFVKKETSESSGGNRGGRGGGGFRGGGNRGRGGGAAGERGGFRGERDAGGGGNFERRRPPPQQTQGYGGRGGNSRHHESGTATGSRAAAATAVVVDTTNISAFPELSAA